MIKILLLLTVTLLFTACQDKTYSRIYKKDALDGGIPTLTLSESNQTIKTMLTSALKKRGFRVASGSPYALEIEGTRYSHKCNNPNTATYDATYDGFIKLTLSKHMKRIYMCQKDYHGALDETIMIELLERMQSDLRL